VLVAGAACLLLALAILTPWLRSPLGLLSFLGAVAGVAAWAQLDGRGGRERPPLPLCVALALPMWGLLVVLCLGVRAYRIPAGHESAAPALHGGDRFLVDLRERTPERGALVVFRAPDGPDYVRRVVALEGDVVRADAQGVHVNGKLVVPGPSADSPPLTVPPGHCYVAGDDLARARDSRHFGPVENRAIRGRPLYVFWAEAWSRIGTTLR
jgi:signal peptidase I